MLKLRSLNNNLTDLSHQVKTLSAQLDGLLAQMMTATHTTAAVPSLLKRYSSFCNSSPSAFSPSHQLSFYLLSFA